MGKYPNSAMPGIRYWSIIKDEANQLSQQWQLYATTNAGECGGFLRASFATLNKTVRFAKRECYQFPVFRVYMPLQDGDKPPRLLHSGNLLFSVRMWIKGSPLGSEVVEDFSAVSPEDAEDKAREKWPQYDFYDSQEGKLPDE
jgi:hypothetical protein